MRWLLSFLILVTPAQAGDWGLFAKAESTDMGLFASAVEPTAPSAPATYDLGPDRTVVVYAEWCQNCPKVVKSFLEGLAVMAGAHHGWTFGNTDDRMIQFIDADEHPDFCEALGETLDEGLSLPFIGKIENNEVVRTWQQGCSEPLDEWTIGWVHKGVNERPKPAKPTKVTVETSGGYPLRGRYWSVEGHWSPSKSFVVRHLQGGEHRGKFDSSWLQSLSWNELMSLHSDDHEGRLKTQYVNALGRTEKRPQTQTVSRPVTTTPQYQSCPTGNCPINSYGGKLKRRRRR